MTPSSLNSRREIGKKSPGKRGLRMPKTPIPATFCSWSVFEGKLGFFTEPVGGFGVGGFGVGGFGVGGFGVGGGGMYVRNARVVATYVDVKYNVVDGDVGGGGVYAWHGLAAASLLVAATK